MPAPLHPPDGTNTSEWTNFALDYLTGQLRQHAPKSLGSPALFPRSPLDGEGPCLIFPFKADRGRGPEDHYVIVGQTEPNYYPAYGLDGDEAFSLHIGTRFMLVMQIAQIPEGNAGVSSTSQQYDPARDARSIVDRIAPQAKIEDVTIAAEFDVDGQIHAVLAVMLNSQRIYIIGRDAPPGFSPRVDLPPQVVYRIHLGEVLRAEPDPDAPILTK